MKNINLAIIIILAFCAFSMQSNEYNRKTNGIVIDTTNLGEFDKVDNLNTLSWDLFLVDAAGSASGIWSVIQLGGGACPFCVAGGAIIGGAAASVPYAVGNLGSDDPNLINGYANPLAIFPSNEFDFIGKEHNKLVRGFLKTGVNFSAENFYRFAKSEYENHEQFREVFDYLKASDLEDILKTTSNIRNVEDAFRVIKATLPSSINKEKFIEDLSNTLNGRNHDEIVAMIKALENSFFIENSSLNENDKLIIKSFFSTLRHSSYLWRY